MKQNVVLANGIKKKMQKAVEDIGLNFNLEINISVETALKVMTQMKYINQDERLRNLAQELLSNVEHRSQTVTIENLYKVLLCIENIFILSMKLSDEDEAKITNSDPKKVFGSMVGNHFFICNEAEVKRMSQYYCLLTQERQI